MQNRSELRFIAPVAALLWAATAQGASTQTGQITVTVTNADGAAVAGAALELTGETMIGGARRANANDEGFWRYNGLPPGPYQIVVTHEGYRKFKRTDVIVRIGRTTAIMVVLPPVLGDDVEEIVVIGGTLPVIDAESVTMGNAISDTFAQGVPTGRSYQALAQLVPGVAGGDTDGNPNVFGSLDEGNQYLVDGVNITDPFTNTFSANFNFDSIQSLEVLTGGRDAEYGNAVGGVINIVTRSGSNEHHADASVYYKSDRLQLKEPGEEELTNSALQPNINVGGPIIKDRLWYYASVEVPFNRRTKPESEGGSVFPDRKGKGPATREFLGLYGLGKLTWQATPDQQFKLLVQGDPTRIKNIGQSQLRHPAAEILRYQGGYLASLASSRDLSINTIWDTQLAIKQSYLQNKPKQGADLSGHTNRETNTTTVNYINDREDTRRRLQFHTKLTHIVDDWFGEHQLKAGLDVSLMWFGITDKYTGGAYYDDDGLDPSDPMSASGVGFPYRKHVMIEAQDASFFSDIEGLFAQDVWKPTTWLTIRPGLRFDSARLRGHDGSTVVNTNCLSPRIGIAVDPFDDGKTKIRAGYYQYLDTGFIELAEFAAGKSLYEREYGYNVVTGEYDEYVGESGGEGGSEAKKYLQNPWNQRRPRTHELLFGVAREIAAGLAFSADFVYRKSVNMWEDDEKNIMWNDDGTQAIGFANGVRTDIWSLGAMRDAYIRYMGVQIQLNKSFSHKWEMMASYTWSRTEGTTLWTHSPSLDKPRQREFEFGYLPDDHTHNLKIYSTHKLPLGINVGTSVTFLSGGPYNRFHFNDFYGSYANLRAPRGYDIDENGVKKELRLPDRFWVDLRVIWNLEELIGQKLELVAQISNLFNSRTPTDLDERNNETFGDVENRMVPFQAELGLRFRL